MRRNGARLVSRLSQYAGIVARSEKAGIPIPRVSGPPHIGGQTRSGRRTITIVAQATSPSGYIISMYPTHGRMPGSAPRRRARYRRAL